MEHVEEDAVGDHVDDVADDPAQHQGPHDHLQAGGDRAAAAAGTPSPAPVPQLSQPERKLLMSLQLPK